MKNYINNCIAKGCRMLESATELFTVAVKQLPHRPFEKGCTIVIPKCPTVMMDNNYYFIVVTVYFPDGYRQYDRLDFESLTRVLTLNDGKIVYADGEVLRSIRNCGTWNEAMLLLSGETLVVENVRSYEITSDNVLYHITRVYDFGYYKVKDYSK